MNERRTFRRIAKWSTTVGSLTLFVVIGYTSRVAIDWHNSDISKAFDLSRGAMTYGWRIQEFTPKQAQYNPEPGWSGPTMIAGPARLTWLPSRESPIRPWERLTIPIWPFWLVATVVAIRLWYRDRHATWQVIQQLAYRFKPRKRLRLTIWRIGLACAGHVVVIGVAATIEMELVIFFFLDGFTVGSIPGERGLVALAHTGVGYLLTIFFFGTPAWGVLWAWLFVKWRNRLLMSDPALCCVACGYDLTGNVTGTCPECGQELLTAQIEQMRPHPQNAALGSRSP